MGRQERIPVDGGGREALEGGGRGTGKEQLWSGGLSPLETGTSQGPTQPHRGTHLRLGELVFPWLLIELSM